MAKIVVGIVTLLLLSPVIGMLLVFAVIPALPFVLAIGTVLGPMNLFENGEADEERARYARWLRDSQPPVAPVVAVAAR